MKTKISIFGITLFMSSLLFSSCDEEKPVDQETNTTSTEEAISCEGDKCQRACCLGCKATKGPKKCIVKDGEMPCCMPEDNTKNEEKKECTETQKKHTQKYIDNDWALPTDKAPDGQFCQEWYDYLKSEQDLNDRDLLID